MSKIELVAPCNFGVEAVLSREIKNLGYEIIRVEDGRVSLWLMKKNMQIQPVASHC